MQKGHWTVHTFCVKYWFLHLCEIFILLLLTGKWLIILKRCFNKFNDMLSKWNLRSYIYTHKYIAIMTRLSCIFLVLSFSFIWMWTMPSLLCWCTLSVRHGCCFILPVKFRHLFNVHLLDFIIIIWNESCLNKKCYIESLTCYFFLYNPAWLSAFHKYVNIVFSLFDSCFTEALVVSCYLET